MHVTFWQEPQLWPSDPTGFVFLARAVQTIGAAMFGEEWTTKEVTTDLIRQLPNQANAWPAEDTRALLLLNRPVPLGAHQHAPSDADWATRVIRSAQAASARSQLTEEDWSLAQAEIGRLNQAAQPAIRRLGIVQREIVKCCESGVLASAARPRAGGQMSILATTVWNTEQWHQRFSMCQLNPRKPFDLGFAGDAYCWIFLTSASLDAFLLNLPAANMSAADLPHLSPYLRVMIAVAKKLAITPENQPKKESVVAEIEAAWRDGSPLTSHLAGIMATLLREPGSQLGRRGGRGRNVSGRKKG